MTKQKLDRLSEVSTPADVKAIDPTCTAEGQKRPLKEASFGGYRGQIGGMLEWAEVIKILKVNLTYRADLRPKPDSSCSLVLDLCK